MQNKDRDKNLTQHQTPLCVLFFITINEQITSLLLISVKVFMHILLT